MNKSVISQGGLQSGACLARPPGLCFFARCVKREYLRLPLEFGALSRTGHVAKHVEPLPQFRHFLTDLGQFLFQTVQAIGHFSIARD